MYIVPAHRHKGHGSRMLLWWLKEHVRTVKYFNVNNANFAMKLMLKKAECQEPRPDPSGELQAYVALT